MSEAMRAAASLYNDPRYYSKSEIRIRKNRIRRQRIVRRQIILLSLAIALFIFLLSFLFSSLMADAQTDEYRPEFKYYKTVTVHADETMWEIASANYAEDHYKNINAYISEICSINSISDANSIKAGEALVVPYYSTEYK